MKNTVFVSLLFTSGHVFPDVQTRFVASAESQRIEKPIADIEKPGTTDLPLPGPDPCKYIECE